MPPNYVHKLQKSFLHSKHGNNIMGNDPVLNYVLTGLSSNSVPGRKIPIESREKMQVCSYTQLIQGLFGNCLPGTE